MADHYPWAVKRLGQLLLQPGQRLGVQLPARLGSEGFTFWLLNDTEIGHQPKRLLFGQRRVVVGLVLIQGKVGPQGSTVKQDTIEYERTVIEQVDTKLFGFCRQFLA